MRSDTAAIAISSLTHFHAARSKESEPVNVFKNLDLALAKGRVLAILGPSGCGKSTLLRLFAGLERPASGELAVFGEDPLPQTKAGEITLLTPHAPLLPWRSAIANVRLPLDLLGRPRALAMHKAEQLLRQVCLQEERWDHRPHELSEGQLQRLRLAQAMITEPRLLLLDEPFSNVDEGLRATLLDLVTSYLLKDRQRSAAFVTHHAHEAATIADDIIILAGEPATIRRPEPVAEAPADRSSDQIDLIAEDLRTRLLALVSA